MSRFAVIEICKPQLGKEKYCKHKVYNGEHYIVHHLLDLIGSGFPCPLDSTCNVALGKYADGQCGHYSNHDHCSTYNSYHFLFHNIVLSQYDGAMCQSSNTFPLMLRLSVRFAESIPAGVQQSIAHVYTVYVPSGYHTGVK